MPGIARFAKKPPKDPKKAPPTQGTVKDNVQDDPMLGVESFGNENDDGMNDDDFSLLPDDFGGMDNEGNDAGFDTFKVDLGGFDDDEDEVR